MASNGENPPNFDLCRPPQPASDVGTVRVEIQCFIKLNTQILSGFGKLDHLPICINSILVDCQTPGLAPDRRNHKLVGLHRLSSAVAYQH